MLPGLRFFWSAWALKDHGSAESMAIARSAKAVAYARRSASSELTRSTREGPIEVFDVMAVVPSAPSSPSRTNTSRPVATVSVWGCGPPKVAYTSTRSPARTAPGGSGTSTGNARSPEGINDATGPASAAPRRVLVNRLTLGHVGTDGLPHGEGHGPERSRRRERRRDLRDPEHRLGQDRSTLDGT